MYKDLERWPAFKPESAEGRFLQSSELIRRIRDSLESLTDSERLLAEFFLQHSARAAFWTAAKCARAVGVSESTVIRFARTLGYESYSELQRAIQEEIEEHLCRPIPQRLEGATGSPLFGVGHLSAAISYDIRNLQETLLSCSEEFDEAVELIVGAERLFVIGLRASAAPAGFLGYALNLMLPNVKTINGGPETHFDELMSVDPRSTVIAFSFARKTKRTLQMVHYARQEGAKVVAVTDSALSSLASAADVSLIVSTQSPAYIESLTATLSLSLAIVSAVGNKRKAQVMSRLVKAERLLVDNGILLAKPNSQH